ncbi:MAG: TIGR01777 family oxidoreductase, partial [Balneolaceae bacterium]
MENTKQILITGGTGFIGGYLCEELARQGHFLTIITRSPKKYQEEEAKNQRYIGWDDNLAAQMEKTDIVINLAGENLFGQRWTDDVKDRLYNSRIKGTRKLVEAMKAADNRPDLFISASGINYYKTKGDQLIDESGEPGDDFLATICIDWEKEARMAEKLQVRTAIPRIAPVLQEGGGMIDKMKLPFMLFVGGPIGSGRQFVPWIHMEDMIRAIIYPMEKPDFEGPYNACSPDQVTMNELSKTLGKVMNRPSMLRVPEFALKMVLGEAAAPVLGSLNVQPKKL